MNVSSVGSSNSFNLSALQQTQASQQLNATQETGGERESDGDRDDGAKAVAAPAPTVNLNGQTVGALLNVTV
jgi:uncharacterized protein YfaP (DUF2135 family)